MSEGLGNWGEDRAVHYLRSNGWIIEDKNYDTTVGECDIIGWDDDTLVFVEVKTRKGDQFGAPEEAVTREKRDHLRNVAQLVMSDLDDDVDARFDVLAIEMNGTESSIRHIENAFGAFE